MAVNLVFLQAFVFSREHLGRDEHVEEGMNAEYFALLKNEMDAMRRDVSKAEMFLILMVGNQKIKSNLIAYFYKKQFGQLKE